jgi:hypothetical protein
MKKKTSRKSRDTVHFNNYSDPDMKDSEKYSPERTLITAELAFLTKK